MCWNHVSKFYVHERSGDCAEIQILDPRYCVSKTLPGSTNAAGPRTTL